MYDVKTTITGTRAAPPARKRLHKQIQTAEQKQCEREERRIAHPDERLLLRERHERDDDR
jgi:hypothetical protein